jgi:hypothetical protein
MRKRIAVLPPLLLMFAACGAVTSRAPIKSTPDEVNVCASTLLGSMGYQIVDDDPLLRAERAKHAGFGHQRADYDRVTVAVTAGEIRVRGETVVMNSGVRLASPRGGMSSSGGGTTLTPSSREVRVDVKRITMECGGS